MKAKIIKYKFYDFDGTLIDSPMPDEGRIHWKKIKGTEYPHLGWWGREESLDLSVFDIKAFDNIKNDLEKSFDNGDKCWILTSRLKKLSNNVIDVLKYNNIDINKFDGMSFFNGRDKGQRILDIIKNEENEIEEIQVFEDREKEFIVLEDIREYLEKLGIKYIIHKC